MIRCFSTLVLGALVCCAGCGKNPGGGEGGGGNPMGGPLNAQPELTVRQDGVVVPGAGNQGPPAAVPPGRAGADNATNHKDLKNPLVRVLMDSLDNVEGAVASDMDLTRKTLRENDAILDKAFRDIPANMRRANTKHAAVRITHPPQPARVAPRVNPVQPDEQKKPDATPPSPSAPGPTGTLPPAGVN